jgi:hypothetical protein
VSVTWNNVYSQGSFIDWDSAKGAAAGRHPTDDGIPSPICGAFVRVEQRWNGHWLRPCVGMRSSQASHRIRYGMKFIVIGVEPRHD